MAANKFATTLHRHTNKITLVLVYALLEWILIVLLLLNALFSYLIIKFSDYFGLRRPCLWCSRLDHIFEPAKFHNSYRSLVCEAHALEISKLGYCSNHRKLAEALDMCEDCSSSSENELSEKFAFFPWMKQLGVLQENGDDKVSQNGEVVLRCSCCDINLDTKFRFHDYQPIPRSWGDSDNIEKEVCDLESKVDDRVDENGHVDRSPSGLMEVTLENNQGADDNIKVHVREREEKTLDDSLFLLADFVCDKSVADESKISDTTIEKLQEPIIKEDVNVLMNDPSCHQTVMVSGGCREDISCEIQPKHLEFYIDQDDCHLIPIEFMGSTSNQEQNERSGDQRAEEGYGNEDFVLEFDEDVGTRYELVVEDNSLFEENLPLLSCHGSEDEPKVELFESRDVAQDGISSQMLIEFDEQVGFPRGDDGFQENSDMEEDIKEPENSQVSEETFQMQGDEIEADVSIGTEIPDRELIDDFQAQAFAPPCVCTEEASSISNLDSDVQVEFSHVSEAHSDGDDGFEENSRREEHKSEWRNSEVTEEALQMQANETEAHLSTGSEIPDQKPIDDVQAQEGPLCLSTEDNPMASSGHFHEHKSHDSKKNEEDEVEFRSIAAEISLPAINSHLALCSEADETEEDRIPNTPIDGLHHSYRKFLSIERRESATEDSLDGSVMSDIEAADGVPTIEKLKSALRNERKVLNALYVELEEERSASAVATSHTMAMINRLQEEKAAVQMEALQYQRMMEEQAAYDQEALQLLNELMVKREKEKAEVEKELEIYRRRVENYEVKERIMLKKRTDGSPRNGTSSSSVSCSNAEESDGLSVDLNHEANEEERFGNHQDSGKQNTPPDAVLYLEESLATFEDERMSILEELKALEEKLITLSDEEEQQFEDVKPIEHLYEENGNGYHEDYCDSSEANGIANGHYKEMNGKHKERKMGGTKAKRLLPLFDATTDAHIEDEMLILHDGVDSVVKFDMDMDRQKLSIEEDVDHVYERLQALEADREFLKHCITSLKKGDRGIELLQEILLHLRDLRSVELRARNMGDNGVV